MTRFLRSLPRHALATLRTDLARDLYAFAAVILFIALIIGWSVHVADNVSLRRYT